MANKRTCSRTALCILAAFALLLVWLVIEQLRLFVLAIAFAVAAVTTF